MLNKSNYKSNKWSPTSTFSFKTSPLTFSPGQHHKNIPRLPSPLHLCTNFKAHLHPGGSSPTVKLHNIAQCYTSILSNNWLHCTISLINCNGFGKECTFDFARHLFLSPCHSFEINSCVCLHTFLPQAKKSKTLPSVTDYMHMYWSEIYSSYYTCSFRNIIN